MTDFKVGDRVRAIRDTMAPHTQEKLLSGYETDVLAVLGGMPQGGYPWLKLALPPGYDGPEWLCFEARDFELVQPPAALLASLDLALKANASLRDDLDQANDLVGALEHLLAAEREVSRVDRLLSAYKRALQAAEDGYRKARDSFDRASSESDTNGGESK